MKVEKGREKKNFIWRKVLIIVFWLFVWQMLAWIVDSTILLEGPIAVCNRLFEDFRTVEYYLTVGASVLRIAGGFVCGMLIAVLFSVVSAKSKLFEEVFMPVVQFFKSAPITCFVVLLLIWTGSENLAFYIAVLVTFPPIYFNLLEGLKQLDNQLLEMARVYRMPFKNRMRYIYLPGIEPFFISALTLAIGTAFKAGVAAEIIGTPDYSMGERIYMSKIYLDTAGVLSWMITIIVVAYLCEKLFVKVANFYLHKKKTVHVARKKQAENEKDYQPKAIVFENCTVTFEKNIILDNFSKRFEVGKIYAITGNSGIGKTTLLKTIMGLIKPSKGECRGSENVKAVVFQENRLFEEYTAVDNVYATGHCYMDCESVQNALEELLPKESLLQPLREFSGGMKRRVELARAMLSCGEMILLDEPFNGLDDETKERAISFINKYKQGRTVILTTHCPADIQNVKAEEYKL